MADPISAVTGIVGAVNGIVGLVRTLTEVAGKVKDNDIRIEFQEKLLQLQGGTLQLQGEALRLQEENATLRDENRKLKEAASDQINPADYRLERNAYWRKADNAGPYCMRCMEEDKKARALSQPDQYHTTGLCTTCNNRYGDIFNAKPIPGPIVY